MNNCRTISTPKGYRIKPQQASEDYEAGKDEIEGYQKLKSSLQWVATMTRPDISYAVSRCSRYSSNPTSNQDTALKRILRYIAGSKNLGLRCESSRLDGTLIR